jgi:hypothetical protein
MTVTALGALSKLPKNLTEGVLAKDFDGDQIYEILQQVLFSRWIKCHRPKRGITTSPLLHGRTQRTQA